MHTDFELSLIQQIQLVQAIFFEAFIKTIQPKPNLLREQLESIQKIKLFQTKIHTHTQKKQIKPNLNELQKRN